MMAADNTAPKQRGTPYKPGQSGNPAGRPPGSRNKATLAIEANVQERTHRDRLCRFMCTIVAEPTYKQMLIDAGIEPTLDSSPEKFRQSLAADVALCAPVVKTLALKID
jgi:uncharacterized protein DUF5681